METSDKTRRSFPGLLMTEDVTQAFQSHRLVRNVLSGRLGVEVHRAGYSKAHIIRENLAQAVPHLRTASYPNVRNNEYALFQSHHTLSSWTVFAEAQRF